MIFYKIISFHSNEFPLIPMNFQVVEAPLKFLFQYEVKVYWYNKVMSRHLDIIILLENCSTYNKILGWVKSFVIFWYMLVCFYIIWSKLFNPCKVPVVVGSIMIVGARTQCALLHFIHVCNILVRASLLCVYHGINIVQSAEGTCCGW